MATDRRRYFPARGLLLSLLLCLVVTAQAMELTFHPVGENRGLNARMPVDLMVDSRGYLWVGSREGLYRYDGYRATLFEPDADDPLTVTDLDIRALFEDSDGIIWVATNTGGLNRLDPTTGLFTSYRHRADDPATITHDSVYGMAEGPGGDLWMGTQIGLSRLDRTSGAVTRYLHDPDDASSLSANYVFTVFRDSRNTLWVATIGGGLNRYNPASDDFTSFDLAGSGGSIGRNDLFAIVEDSEGDLWIGTRSGLLRLQHDTMQVERVDLSGSGGAQPVVTDMQKDPAGNLWLGTLSHGLIRVDPRTREWAAFTDYSPTERGGLAAQPQISVVFSDDLMFVGTWGAGLWATRLPDTNFEFFGEALPVTGLRLQNVSAVLPGPTPGAPFVGSFGGGVQLLRTAARAFEVLPGEEAQYANVGVLALAPGPDGGLFAGTDRGLLELDARGGLRRKFVFRPGEEGGIGEGYVVSLLAADTGDLWVGVGGSGLHRLPAGSSAFEVLRHDPSDPTSLSGDYITSLAADESGYIWVGTRSNGLNFCRRSPWSCQRIGNDADAALRLGHFHVTHVHPDSRGRVWVATDGGGLHEVRRDITGAITEIGRWTERHGLLSDGVMAIVEDDDGSLWLSTRHGLSRLEPESGRVTSYVAETGLPASHFNAHAAARDDRYAYFGSSDGVLAIPLGRPFATRQPAATRITRVERIGAEDLRPASGWVPATYRAGHRDMLAIGFAVLDYAEVPHEYEFRLNDDERWTSLGQRTEVTFLNLAPGSYRFVARGRDVFGLWSQSEPVAIEVVPPVWMASWFRLLMILVALGAIFAGHRIRTRRLKKSAQEIERLGELREQALEAALGARSELSGLTARQKEVLQLIAEGCSTREIAERLSISIKTVETHRAHLMERLEIYDVAGLVRLAIRARLISPHA